MDHHDILRGFRDSVERTPDACAIRCPERTLTYAELDRESNALAAAIVEAGGAAGATPLAAIALRRRDLVIAAILGALEVEMRVRTAGSRGIAGETSPTSFAACR